MSSSDRSRKLFVRSLLAGTSTLATLMGAQSLALIDNQAFDATPVDNEVVELTAIPTLMALPTAEATMVLQNSVEPTIAKVAPNITIFRQSGATNVTDGASASVSNESSEVVAVASNTNVILPPNPVELQAPEPIVIVQTPVVIQQPVQQFQAPVAQPQAQPQQQQQNNNNNKNNNNNSRSRSGSSK